MAWHGITDGKDRVDVNDDGSIPVTISTAIDPVFNVPVFNSIDHYETHEGDHYFVKTFLVDTGGTGSTSYFAFTTPDTLKKYMQELKLYLM